MKKLIMAAAFALAAIAPVSALAVKKTTTTNSTAWWCTNPKYAAIYQYPTGSYWQHQIATYPDYYAANDAYYRATYGC